MLSVQGIEASYGAAQALFGVDLTIEAGQAHALMGRNGMGKTTTIRAICGLTPAQKGDITFQGRKIAHLPSHKIARAGIGLVPEGRRCFATLTVRENLIATARPGAWDVATVSKLFPRLEERAGQMAATLSGGEQQMLAIGRALMTNPALLILDEATEGLAPTIRAEIWAALRALKADGQSLLIVDKTLKEILPVADACTILERGRSVWSGPPDALTDDLTTRYIGV
ncbi:branched-chain amino acid transport system ATP-binding protein [Rubricella aquisinus]|uniref:Branched-chain amino acid transport system ATP-binding protein n=1 Tax=Rubricella aquisinus TaxID=2028108 RepID=A0A840X5F9_9RHOB|nr:ABC transporter ATP-binding protein [Rubricella aquisinus]MBB5517026.1 branched-chain amino acid transport system ATP-binding protein [Rubricella aquisinus]